MRAFLFSCSALALVLTVAPASAMMCGGMGQQAQASKPGQSAMMCGRQATVDDPMADRPAQAKPQTKPQTGMGMCPCCKGMAMMQGDGVRMQGDDPHKGMDMSPRQ